ncbi:MAG: 1-acyl-sn-glycerol-3-phosphate acyltransferase [Paeniclostridium sp.]|uniref:lysophospholipid acyltransferase family protein n=1 Tax=Paraclostridium sordellii TaxID=1505 RepID=UPI0005E4B67C|nr:MULTISPECIES: lysophospholipid acyltransferase family protein [Paeniclostridium]MBW4861889.1 1-acyl-sn-glycerol-3-phosphate acyltransferase [Paeniclostridium sp.]MBW4873847.1 1-acyl-sn-glycerol-3-phosphate acyltransferase [Paeniclostridium sp.]CEN93969.1 acyltransferase [[Clostridium] sordellii] [Paeniclostridium sordellii]CEN94985.1 acyltransferase [[Clostridium] sordellii] [Paeniclostridium sordellii]
MKFYDFVTGVLKTFTKLFFKFEVIGGENIPHEGAIILAANHRSNLDPVFLAACMHKNRPIKAVAKKELFKIKPLGYILNKLNVIPVDRNNPTVSTIKNILKVLRAKECLGMFPEGTRNKGTGFLEAKAGLGMFAIKGKALVVPVSIISSYKIFNKVTLYIDKPISFEEYYKEKLSTEDYQRLSQNVLDLIKDNYLKYDK